MSTQDISKISLRHLMQLSWHREWLAFWLWIYWSHIKRWIVPHMYIAHSLRDSRDQCLTIRRPPAWGANPAFRIPLPRKPS